MALRRCPARRSRAGRSPSRSRRRRRRRLRPAQVCGELGDEDAPARRCGQERRDGGAVTEPPGGADGAEGDEQELEVAAGAEDVADARRGGEAGGRGGGGQGRGGGGGTGGGPRG